MKIDGTTVHKKVTAYTVSAACERRMNSLDDPGFCICCGLEHLGIEPDARQYECEACGERAVYGCEELLLYFA
jgi:predicted RNA-binding Zn-ribbon protein involved in translation (DUF1610 family)